MSATLHLSAYRAPAWLPDGHSQTIYPALCLGGARPATSERWATPDGGEITVDRLPGCRGMPLLWLLHDLEGGSDNHYARALMRAAQATAVLAWRGQPFSRLRRRGEHPAARLPRGRLRRSGLAAGATGQRRPAAVRGQGVSLGGNMLLKHLGEAGASAPLCAAAAKSARWLAAAGPHAGRGTARQLYTCMFFARSSRPAWPARRHPGLIDVRRAQASHAARFDDAVTAPLHGFAGVKIIGRAPRPNPGCARLPGPPWLLNARNDHFLPSAARPRPNQRGGHAGIPRREAAISALPAAAFPDRLDWRRSACWILPHVPH